MYALNGVIIIIMAFSRKFDYFYWLRKDKSLTKKRKETIYERINTKELNTEIIQGKKESRRE